MKTHHTTSVIASRRLSHQCSALRSYSATWQTWIWFRGVTLCAPLSLTVVLMVKTVRTRILSSRGRSRRHSSKKYKVRNQQLETKISAIVVSTWKRVALILLRIVGFNSMNSCRLGSFCASPILRRAFTINRRVAIRICTFVREPCLECSRTNLRPSVVALTIMELCETSNFNKKTWYWRPKSKICRQSSYSTRTS